MNWVKAAFLYFVSVFGAGFVLGTIRVLWVVPWLGTRTAELLEMPLMVLASFISAKWILGRFRGGYTKTQSLALGVVALLFMIGMELAVSLLLLNAAVAEVVTKRDPISGLAYVFALLLFTAMPLLIGSRKGLLARPVGLIGSFIAEPDVSECHEILVRAPAPVVFEVAEHLDVRSIPTVNAIFRLRELIYRTQSPKRTSPISLVAETLSLGWGVLAHRPGEELVMGAVTQPWVGDVKFRSVPPEAFSNFAEPGYVKIAWSLEVDLVEPQLTRFRTQTQVKAMDAASRRKFRLYWTFAGPGIVLIRLLTARAIRRQAERRANLKRSLNKSVLRAH